MRTDSILRFVPVRTKRSAFPNTISALLITAAAWLAAMPANADCPSYTTSYPNGRATAFFKPSFPDRAKDFAVVQMNGFYHVIYTRVDRTLADAATTKDFGHAYSSDLVHWYPLPNLNPDGTYTNGVPNHPAWDASHVWAPSIISIGSTYYMFFTGVDASGNQQIGVSTSTNLSLWTPSASNPVWTCASIPWAAPCPGTNAQLRDPYVMRDVIPRDGTQTPGWLMYYTANPSSGQTAIGVAWASYNTPTVWNNLGGPTSSLSKLFTGPKTESPHPLLHNGTWYLFFAGRDGSGTELEGYLTAADPVATSWTGPTWFTSVLDTSAAGGHPGAWFASEHITVGANDYLMFVHDYDPDPCDPQCINPPITVGPSTLEAKRIAWNPGFAVADLPVTTDGSEWLQRCAAGSPSARWGASTIYDPTHDRIILFGGMTSASNGSAPVYYNDTWSYSPSTHAWTPLATAGTPPSARAGHRAMYDPARQRMLVLGPGSSQIYALSVMGTPTWSVVTTGSGAPDGTDIAAALDPVHDRLYTVSVYSGVRKLELSTLAWSSITNSIPELMREGTMVYDASQNRLLFVGGWDATGALLCQAPAKYPSNIIQAVNLNSPGFWNPISQAPWTPRYATTAFADVDRNRLLVFGGVGWADHCTCGSVCPIEDVWQEIPLNDVWSMDLTSLVWTQRTPLPGTEPPARGHHAGAYDPTRREIDVFGGGEFHDDASHLDCLSVCNATPVYNYRNDTWTFRTDGVPPAAVTTLQTSGACNAVNLTWTAPGDDGSTGTAALYDLRGSSVPITAANFSTSPQIASFAPTGPAGTSETFSHNVENCSPVYYYALKTRDLAGNWSSISNLPSGSSACNCGGGGGGGGCPFVYVPTAHGWSVENSILGRSRDGGSVRDVYRIKAPMTAENGVYRVQIREDEQEVTTLERVQLVAVDHDPGLRAFDVEGQWMLGRLVPPQRVRTGSGIDVTSRFVPGGGPGFRGQPGDALTFEFPTAAPGLQGPGSAPGPRLRQIFELEPLEKLALRRGIGAQPASGQRFDSWVLDRSGVQLDVEDPSGRWSTVTHRYPREFRDEMALEAPLAGRVRVSFVGEHSIASAGRLEETSSATGREATLLTALHTRAGDVTEAVRAEDQVSTTLRRGDRIELRFQAPESTPGKVRDLFLISNGVYTSAPSGPDAGPPPAFALLQNHPNPFADETEIGFSLPRDLDLRLEVFDLAGRRIAVLARGPYSAGAHSTVWDRRDAGRSRVRPGIYLCRLTAGGAEARMRMVVLP